MSVCSAEMQDSGWAHRGRVGLCWKGARGSLRSAIVQFILAPKHRSSANLFPPPTQPPPESPLCCIGCLLTITDRSVIVFMSLTEYVSVGNRASQYGGWYRLFIQPENTIFLACASHVLVDVGTHPIFMKVITNEPSSSTNICCFMALCLPCLQTLRGDMIPQVPVAKQQPYQGWILHLHSPHTKWVQFPAASDFIVKILALQGTLPLWNSPDLGLFLLSFLPPLSWGCGIWPELRSEVSNSRPP